MTVKFLKSALLGTPHTNWHLVSHNLNNVGALYHKLQQIV